MRLIPILQVSAFICLMGFSACGSDKPAKSEPEKLVSLDQENTWMRGEWHFVGTPSSWGDLGADIRHMHIAPAEMWVETFGHLAAESPNFNTNGFDYGGNCLYRVHASNFGMKTNKSSGRRSFAFYRDSFELLDDPGNRHDCAEQIKRINAVTQNPSEPTEIGVVTSGDDGLFKLDTAPASNAKTDERALKLYRRQ
jgi:hypothetical protein